MISTPIAQKINFSPINNIKLNNVISFRGLNIPKKPELTEDVFQPTVEKDLLNYNEKDYDEIVNSVKDENFIGAGFEGKVYETENPDYVIKVPRKFFTNGNLNKECLKIDLTKKDITEQDEVNHIVKRYKNGVTVMNKVEGKPLSDIDNLEEIADLPVSAYQKLLNQILRAEDKNMEFDFAMNNLMYDKETQTMTAIDFRKIGANKNKLNTLEKMYFVFNSFKKPYEKKVSGKIISAALSNLKSDSEYKTSPLRYDFDQITKYLKHNCPESKAHVQEIEENIKNIVILKSTFGNTNQAELDDYIDYTNKLIKTNLCEE